MKKVLLVVLAILALTLASCTFPAAEEAPEISPEEIAQTMIAETLAAAPTETPVPAAPTDTPTPTPENTATPIPTSSVPLISVSEATNCRTGPDIAYTLVLVFQPGAQEEIVGQYSQGNYWVIKTPNNETCWLWGEYATVEGDTSSLPDMVPPPPPVVEEEPTAEAGPTPQVAVGPAAPTNFQASATCQIVEMNGQKLIQGKTDKITWNSSNGATGYKVYVNGVEEKNLNGNATGTTFDAITYKSNQYGVAAYSIAGTSNIVTIPAPSCP